MTSSLQVSKYIIIVLSWLCLSFSIKAQEVKTEVGDSLHVMMPDSVVESLVKSADSTLVAEGILNPVSSFKPNSTKAVLLSAAFPGLGQIYNRKYWKLPLVYGGFMGFAYAITWNNKNYKDYNQAYVDILKDAKNNPNDESKWEESWTDIKPNTKPTDTNFQNYLKGRRDYFRRYRDLSIILTAGFYFICMVDAYVDAEMFNFDISPDLSMRIEPVITAGNSYNTRTVGLNCSIKF